MWHRKGDLDKALADMDQAIRSNFADAKLYCDRGLIWYEKGSYDRAVADFNRAVRLSGTLTATCLRRGVLLHATASLIWRSPQPTQRSVDPKIFDVYRRSTRQSATHPPQAAPGAAAPEPAGDP
jgi:tetratricopeptide (TPR) repeat protein